MARTTRKERMERRQVALQKVSNGIGISEVVDFVSTEWGCSRSSAQRDCRWAHDKLQLSIDSHEAQHLIAHMAINLQRIPLKAEEDKQYAAVVDAQKMIYELLLRWKMDDEAAKVSCPGWGYRHGNTRS